MMFRGRWSRETGPGLVLALVVVGLAGHAVTAVKPPASTSRTTEMGYPDMAGPRNNQSRYAKWKKEDFFSHSYSVKDVQLGCKELRSKRYISDGFCTSIKPVTEVVCSGICLPVSELPWYTEVVDEWTKRSTTEWRCVNDVVRRKRVHLICRNGERRSYRIRTVRSCKCKKFIKNKG